MAQERELAELLRTAAPTVLPPASFDHASVVAGSRRVRARRQRVLAGGLAVVAVVLAGGSTVAVLGGAGRESTVSAVGAQEQERATREPAAGAVPQGPDRLPEDPTPTRTPPGAPAPQVLEAGACGPADRSVYAALVGVFPDLAAQAPFALSGVCPPGTTGAGVLLAEAGVVGRVEVLVGPGPGPARAAAAGETVATAATPGGRTVTVVSVAAAGASAGPYAGTLGGVAERVAAALG